MPISIKGREIRTRRLSSRNLSLSTKFTHTEKDEARIPMLSQADAGSAASRTRIGWCRDSLQLLGHPEVEKSGWRFSENSFDDDDTGDIILDQYLSSFVSLMEKTRTHASDDFHLHSSDASGKPEEEEVISVLRLANSSTIGTHGGILYTPTFFQPPCQISIAPTQSESEIASCRDKPLKAVQSNSKQDVSIRSCLKVSNCTISKPSREISNREMTKSMPAMSNSEGVRFSVVEIREYVLDLGDNPSCKCGPPLSIGWKHQATHVESVIEYETMRRRRRKHHELYLSRRAREKRLLDYGFTSEEIATASEKVAKDRDLRTATVSNIKYYPYEKSMESARRKMMRLLKLRKKDGDMIETLWVQANGAFKPTPRGKYGHNNQRHGSEKARAA